MYCPLWSVLHTVPPSKATQVMVFLLLGFFLFHGLESERWTEINWGAKMPEIIVIWKLLILKACICKWTWNTFWKCRNLLRKQSQIHPGNSRESLKGGWTIPVIKLKDWQTRTSENLDTRAVGLRSSIRCYLLKYIQEPLSLNSFPLSGSVFQAVPKELAQWLILFNIFISELVKNDYMWPYS